MSGHEHVWRYETVGRQVARFPLQVRTCQTCGRRESREGAGRGRLGETHDPTPWHLIDPDAIIARP